MPKSLRLQSALLFTGLALLVCIPSYAYVEYVYVARLVNERAHSLHDLASSIAAVVSENLAERQRQVSQLARAIAHGNEPLNSSEVAAGLDRLQVTYPNYSWIGLTDTTGSVVASTGSLLRGENVADRLWFTAALAGPFVGDPHEQRELSSLLPLAPPDRPQRSLQFLDLSVPVRAETGTLRGVLGAHINWNWSSAVINPLTPTRAKNDQIDVFIIDSGNKIIYPEDRSASPTTKRSKTAAESFSITTWEAGGKYLAVAVPVRNVSPEKPSGWRIVVRQPTANALGEMTPLKHVLLWVALTVAVVFFTLAWWGTSAIGRPIRQLARIAKDIQHGEERTPIDIHTASPDLRNLVNAFSDMSNTLISRKQALVTSNEQLEQKIAERTAELQLANEGLQQLARHDALTGLCNRMAANERLSMEFKRMKRTQVTYCVLMIDIDSFKRINDTYGHADGDQVLKNVAGTIVACLRETDFVARYGGEEFLAILPATKLAGAIIVAERYRMAIAAIQDAKIGQVTVSIGVTEATVEQRSETEAVMAADAQLYLAKRSGKNRTMSAVPAYVRW